MIRLEPVGFGGRRNQSIEFGNEDLLYYFAPRTGFAYRVNEGTVLRGGFGISYTPYPDNSYAYNYPVRSNNAYNPLNSYQPAVLADNVTVPTFPSWIPSACAGCYSFGWNHRDEYAATRRTKLQRGSNELEESLRNVLERYGSTSIARTIFIPTRLRRKPRSQHRDQPEHQLAKHVRWWKRKRPGIQLAQSFAGSSPCIAPPAPMRSSWDIPRITNRCKRS